MKRPCQNCQSAEYTKKIPLEIQGVQTTACDVCSPEEFTCSLEERSGEHVISTGTLHARLDWSRELPVIEARTEFVPLKLSERIRRFFRKMWQGC